MCGILGYAGATNIGLSGPLATLTHRGPDFTGTYTQDLVSLGHCRLSIIDLNDRANQPMESVSKKTVIVFNGEIYNYKELKQNLIKEGVMFRTESDTEVILNGYEKYGTSFFDTLRGMWAFAIYDLSTQQIILSRDPFGIKPLYYTQQGKALYFASELKVMKQFPIQFEPNTDAYFEFFNLGYFIAPETQYRNVHKLLPGETFVWGIVQNTIIEQKLIPRSGPTSDTSSATDPVFALDQALTETVEAHYVADTPVSILLSGGNDSSLIAALSKKLGKTPTAYHVAIPGSSDTFYATKVAKTLDMPLSVENLTDELLCEQYEKTWDILDEPTGDISIIPTTLVYERIKGKSKVVLSGEGGDELFGGYLRHSFLQKHVTVEKKNALHSIFNTFLSTGEIGVKYLNPLFQRVRYKLLQHGYTDDLIGAYLKGVKLIDFPVQDEAIRTRLFQLYETEDQDLVPPALFFDMFLYLSNDLLQKSDTASMAASIEARVPLVDRVLLGKVLPILNSPQVGGDRYDKKILKQVLTKYLPNELVYRDKKGFGVPVSAFYKTRFNDDFHEAAHFHQKNRDIFALDSRLCSMLENHELREILFKKYPRFAFAVVSNWKLLSK